MYHNFNDQEMHGLTNVAQSKKEMLKQLNFVYE